MGSRRGSMTRFRVELLAILLVGCLDEGRPWGLVTVELAVAFEPPAARLDEAGRLKTANDFRIELEGLGAVVGQTELLAQAGAAASFDPANPPPGYSLCHNGHCHADDGRLVPYEDIAIELAGGSGGEVLFAVEGGEFTLSAPGRVTRPTACAAEMACEVVTPATVGLVRVAIDEVRVRGRVFEGRAGAARVPEEGLPFELSLRPDSFGVAATGGWRFGPADRLGLALSATVALPAVLFDRVAWDAMGHDTIAATIGEALVEATGLEVQGRRFD